jgi:hypothetical protein
LVSDIRDIHALTDWLLWIKQSWPDVQCPPLVKFAKWIRERYPTNDLLRYELHQKGDGVGMAKKGHEIVWYMNKQFRCGIEIDRRGRKTVFDYTRYTIDYTEPQQLNVRNWSIFDLLNQKALRKQDRPVAVEKFPYWDEIQQALKHK